MKPTNHLRWITRETDSGIRGFGYSDQNPLTFPLKVLQQFWEYEEHEFDPPKTIVSFPLIPNAGEWRDIETVKEEK